jgi:hypothetical protein
LHETLALVRELNDRVDEASVLNSLGEVARYQRAYERSAASYHGSLALYRELDSRGGAAIVLHNLGLLAMAQNDLPQAMSLFRESMATLEVEAEWPGRVFEMCGVWHAWPWPPVRRGEQSSFWPLPGRRSIPA